MFPTICTIGPLKIYSYGLMLSVSAIVCFLLLSRDAARLKIPSPVISDLIFWTVIGGVIGARVLFIFLNLEYFLEYPVEIIMIQHGGLAWQGSVLFAFLAMLIFLKKKKMTLISTLDLIAPYLALGQAIGRLGCFFNGCCFGKEVEWGLYFPVHNAHLVPTQLYSFASLFLIYLILKRVRATSKIQGQVVADYLLLAALQRFIIQFFRADHVPIFYGLSFFQIGCLIIFLAGTLIHIWALRRDKMSK